MFGGTIVDDLSANLSDQIREDTKNGQYEFMKNILLPQVLSELTNDKIKTLNNKIYLAVGK